MTFPVAITILFFSSMTMLSLENLISLAFDDKFLLLSPKALVEIKNHFSGMLMAYPDSGYFVAPNWQFEDIIEPELLLEYAKGWRENGCLIFGGCCGLGPEHTAALSELK